MDPVVFSMSMSTKPDAETGVVIGQASNARHLRIQLANGEELTAVLPNSRKFGCLFGSLVGWHVKVVRKQPPRMSRVVDLVRVT